MIDEWKGGDLPRHEREMFGVDSVGFELNIPTFDGDNHACIRALEAEDGNLPAVQVYGPDGWETRIIDRDPLVDAFEDADGAKATRPNDNISTKIIRVRTKRSLGNGTWHNYGEVFLGARPEVDTYPAQTGDAYESGVGFDGLDDLFLVFRDWRDNRRTIRTHLSLGDGDYERYSETKH